MILSMNGSYLNHEIESLEPKIKLYNLYRTIKPELDFKVNSDKEIILSFGSTFNWKIVGGL